MAECHARVETEQASKYLQQLCKHFAHKVRSDYDAAAGRVEFPPGLCHITAVEGTLSFYCQSAQPRGLLVMQGIIDDHLSRFAWREAIALSWQDGLPADTPSGVADEMGASSGD